MVTSPHTEHGIPIRNLWHMLLYAWNEVPLRHGWVQEEVERAPTLDALLASILARLLQQRLRIGLGHDYVEREGQVQRIRGRIQFSESLRQRTLERGSLICEFHSYNPNSPRNQILRSTLARLAKAGRFGPDPALARELQQKLRSLVRDLDGIDIVDLTPDLIHRQMQVRHDHDYRLMLSICDLTLQRQMPAGRPGRTPVPALDREALVLHQVYERFVANFYRMQLHGWDVSTHKRLEWHARESSEYLPFMVPDLVLQERATGQMIILDTKFTAHSLVENQWGKPILDSSHLYQLYAYLKSQEHVSEAHRQASGVLLYPAVQYNFAQRIELPEHVIRIECVDLSQPWQEIEQQLLAIVDPA